MGKLSKFYTKQEKTVEKVLPLSKDKMVWNRPGEAQIVEISKYGETLDLEDAGCLIQMQAFVLMTLCVKPDLTNEGQAQIEHDLKVWEAPDRNCILMFYNELLGISTDMMQKLVSERFR